MGFMHDQLADGRSIRLSQYHWEYLDYIQHFATQWMWQYNYECPNMALGRITPKQRLAMAA